MPQSRISGNRQEGYRPEEKTGEAQELFREGRGGEYLALNDIASLKYEDPGKDDFILSLLDAAPSARFVASHRPIERVIESHHNISTWGHDEADVLHQFSACLSLYEHLAESGRMFLINVDDKTMFDGDAFAHFLDKDALSSRAQKLIDEWQPINDLKYQVERTGKEYLGRTAAPRIERLREIHTWINDHEERYLDLCRQAGK
jgi:hypothetical protein